MIANLEGKMVVGQFGSFIWGFMRGYDGTIEEGDVFLTNDPVLGRRRDQPPERLADADADLQGRPDHRVVGHVRPHDRRRRQGAGLAADRRPTVYEEGDLRPADQDHQGGVLQEDILKVILHNCRLPTWNCSDFNAIVAALRTAAIALHRDLDRFGDDVFYSAMEAMLERNKRAMRQLIRQTIIPRRSKYLRGLHLRRRHGHGAVQDRLHDVARGR